MILLARWFIIMLGGMVFLAVVALILETNSPVTGEAPLG